MPSGQMCCCEWCNDRITMIKVENANGTAEFSYKKIKNNDCFIAEMCYQRLFVENRLNEKIEKIDEFFTNNPQAKKINEIDATK